MSTKKIDALITGLYDRTKRPTEIQDAKWSECRILDEIFNLLQHLHKKEQRHITKRLYRLAKREVLTGYKKSKKLPKLTTPARKKLLDLLLAQEKGETIGKKTYHKVKKLKEQKAQYLFG